MTRLLSLAQTLCDSGESGDTSYSKRLGYTNPFPPIRGKLPSFFIITSFKEDLRPKCYSTVFEKRWTFESWISRLSLGKATWLVNFLNVFERWRRAICKTHSCCHWCILSPSYSDASRYRIHCFLDYRFPTSIISWRMSTRASRTVCCASELSKSFIPCRDNGHRFYRQLPFTPGNR